MSNEREWRMAKTNYVDNVLFHSEKILTPTLDLK